MAENDFGIAIIGMAGRFPQADTVQAFWENLLASRECISFYSDEELLAMGISPEFVQHPDYVKAKGEVADIDKFDAAFFGIAPREAELMDLSTVSCWKPRGQPSKMRAMWLPIIRGMWVFLLAKAWIPI